MIEANQTKEDARPRIIKIAFVIILVINIIGYFILSPDGFMFLSSGTITVVLAFSPVIIFWAFD